jgi:hypothetical protein
VFERFTKPSALESAQRTAISLTSERGEANARGIAGKLVRQFKLLDKAEQLKFFEFLAKWFLHGPNNIHLGCLIYCYQQEGDNKSKFKLFSTYLISYIQKIDWRE